jgi:Ran-binding protein 3
MKDVPNGADSAATGDQSTSGSESGRGRLRRKRSREDFEDEVEKPSEKKVERHLRKKSRDVTSPRDPDVELIAYPVKNSFEQIDEHDGDEEMTSSTKTNQPQTSKADEPTTPEADMPDRVAPSVLSPASKRTHDQAKTEEGGGLDATNRSTDDVMNANKPVGERSPKRQRDKSDFGAQLTAESSSTKVCDPIPDLLHSYSTTKQIPPGSGFANTAAASPFAALSPTKPPAPSSKSLEEPSRTSDDKFKASGFGTFANSPASPFGGLGSSNAKSPFGAATGGSKLTSFASSTATSTANPASGFGSLGGSSVKSGFGGSTTTLGVASGFGGSLASGGFGGLNAPKSGISSFATPGTSTITGLSQKPARPFGAAGDEKSDDDEEDEDEDGDENEGSGEPGEARQGPERRSTVLQPQRKLSLSRSFAAANSVTAVETGEEGEEPHWVGRAKLYAMSGEGNKKGWQERGVGPFKLNITKDSPKKARFVLRADGTHRLLLNAAVTKYLKIGDSEGNSPNDGRLLFNTPTPDGGIEMHLLKVRCHLRYGYKPWNN